MEDHHLKNITKLTKKQISGVLVIRERELACFIQGLSALDENMDSFPYIMMHLHLLLLLLFDSYNFQK